MSPPGGETGRVPKQRRTGPRAAATWGCPLSPAVSPLCSPSAGVPGLVIEEDLGPQGTGPTLWLDVASAEAPGCVMQSQVVGEVTTCGGGAGSSLLSFHYLFPGFSAASAWS